MDINEVLKKYTIEELLQLENETLNDEKIIITETPTQEILIKLHNQTKLLFPSYLLRIISYEQISTMNEKTLDVLLEAGSKLAFEELNLRYEDNITKASDELLTLQAQKGDEDSKEILTLRYKNHINLIIQRVRKKYFFRGLENDDLFQESNLGFFKAIEVFKIERRTKFKDFSRHVIERHLGTIMNKSRNLRHKALNESFSFNTPVNTTNNDTTFEDLLPGEDISPEQIYINKQTYTEIIKTFTKNERGVLKEYSKGYTYEEIAFKLIEKKKLVDLKNLNYEQLTEFLKSFETTAKDIKNHKELFNQLLQYYYIEGLNQEEIAYTLLRKKINSEYKNLVLEEIEELVDNEEFQDILNEWSFIKQQVQELLKIINKIEKIVNTSFEEEKYQIELNKEIDKQLYLLAKTEIEEKLGNKVSKAIINEFISKYKQEDFEKLISKKLNYNFIEFKEEINKNFKIVYKIISIKKYTKNNKEVLDEVIYKLIKLPNQNENAFKNLPEEQLFSLFYWHEEVVSTLKKMKKSVDNTIQRIRKKGEAYKEQENYKEQCEKG